MLELTAPGSTDLDWAFYRPRVLTGLRGFHIFGGTLNRSRVNHAPGGAHLTVVGAPAVEVNRVRLTGGTTWFETGLAETAEYTFLYVARCVATPTALADGVQFVGNYAGTGLTQRGHAVYAASAQITNTVGLNNGGAAANQNSVAPRDVTAWHIGIGGAGPATGYCRDETGGATDADALAHPRAAPTANTIRIGAAYTTFAGQGDFALVALWNRWLSDAERATTLADVRALMTARGITGL